MTSRETAEASYQRGATQARREEGSALKAGLAGLADLLIDKKRA